MYTTHITISKKEYEEEFRSRLSSPELISHRIFEEFYRRTHTDEEVPLWGDVTMVCQLPMDAALLWCNEGIFGSVDAYVIVHWEYPNVDEDWYATIDVYPFDNSQSAIIEAPGTVEKLD